MGEIETGSGRVTKQHIGIEERSDTLVLGIMEKTVVAIGISNQLSILSLDSWRRPPPPCLYLNPRGPAVPDHFLPLPPREECVENRGQERCFYGSTSPTIKESIRKNLQYWKGVGCKGRWKASIALSDCPFFSSVCTATSAMWFQVLQFGETDRTVENYKSLGCGLHGSC